MVSIPRDLLDRLVSALASITDPTTHEQYRILYEEAERTAMADVPLEADQDRKQLFS